MDSNNADFDNAESKGRNKFKQMFENYFHDVSYSEYRYSFWDFSGLTNYKNLKYIIEIKYRNRYDFENLSGATWCENEKIYQFYNFQIKHPDYKCFYVNFFNDKCAVFNLSDRFKNHSKDLKINIHSNMPISTVVDRGTRNKKIASLSFNKKIDKSFYY